LRFALFLLLFLNFSCATVGTRQTTFRKVEHVYISPVTNRTHEEALDVLFTKVADDVFYSDPRFKVDQKPIPGTTIIVKPSVDSISTFAVGFDRYDRATEYELTVKSTIKLIRYGFKKPFKVFKITRYGFYSNVGNPLEIERNRKECLSRIAEQIFSAVGEKLYAEGKEIESNAEVIK